MEELHRKRINSIEALTGDLTTLQIRQSILIYSVWYINGILFCSIVAFTQGLMHYTTVPALDYI